MEITPIILLVTVMAASYPGKNICYYPRYILITICLSASCLLSYRAWRFKSEERELKSMIHEYGYLPGAGLEDKLFGYYPCYKNNHIYIASCAMQFYKNKSYPKAEVMLRRASVLFPSSRILYDLGNCCHRLPEIRGSRTVSVHRLQHGSGTRLAAILSVSPLRRNRPNP